MIYKTKFLKIVIHALRESSKHHIYHLELDNFRRFRKPLRRGNKNFSKLIALRHGFWTYVSSLLSSKHNDQLLKPKDQFYMNISSFFGILLRRNIMTLGCPYVSETLTGGEFHHVRGVFDRITTSIKILRRDYLEEIEFYTANFLQNNFQKITTGCH